MSQNKTISSAELSVALKKCFPDSYPEEGQGYTILLQDCQALAITSVSQLLEIVELHLADAVLQDFRERHEVDRRLRASGLRSDVANKEIPSIVRWVRKCFLLHFGLSWERYQSNSLQRNLAGRLVKAFRQDYEPVRTPGTPEPPEILYLYMKAEHLPNLLSSLTLRLSSPITFNDWLDIQTPPLVPDCEDEIVELLKTRRAQIVFGDDPVAGEEDNVVFFLNSLVRKLRAPTTTLEDFTMRHQDSDKKTAQLVRIQSYNLKQYWRVFAKYFRVLCLTEEHENNAMWAHYGDNNKGVVIAFDIKSSSSFPFQNLMPVLYESEPPPIATAQEIVDDILGVKSIDKIHRLADLARWKTPDWKYEKEWRSVSLKSNWRDGALDTCPLSDLHDFISIDASSIKAIFLGIHTTKEHQKRILEVTLEHLPDVSIYRRTRTEIAPFVHYEQLN